MWEFLAAVAAYLVGGAVANENRSKQRAKAQEQLKRDMRMQYAQMLDPSVPTWGYQQQRFDEKQEALDDAHRQAMIGGAIDLIPAGVSAVGKVVGKASQPSVDQAIDEADEELISGFRAQQDAQGLPWKQPFSGRWWEN